MGEVPRWLEAGRRLANPAPGENIVISGMSGCFPESDNIYEFRDNLANKADMVTSDTRRWQATHPEIPKRAGKIWNVEKFDAGFFGIHSHQADAVDPLCRILMEKAYECVLDAGLNPSELKATNTGVFVGACASESEKFWLYDNLESQAFAITGSHRSMLASRVSYWFGLKGPAFVMDTACSSSFFAFEHAYRSIREGHCDRAIVAGSNLCLHPYVTLQFSRLGVLSLDGACKCFDEAANGYTRSEAICAILLQKSNEAKRIYAEIIHSKVNADGYKEQGITYPSGLTQTNLIREVYQECGLNPTDISYMEAHGTGTKVGDPEELKAIAEIFLTDRKRPLLIGSVKSNIGHTEPTSGLCSVVKVILSMENGKILPNMNYNNPRRGIKCLEEGKLKVVSENTDWPDNNGLVGINSFGFGGANCHTILKWHGKIKKNFLNDNLPRLICLSARTEEAVHYIFDDIKNRKLDYEFVRLFHEVYRSKIADNNFRGFAIFGKGLELLRSSCYQPDEPLKLEMIFGGKLENICFEEFLQISSFQEVVHNIGNILKPHDLNPATIMATESNKFNTLKVCIMQIGIIVILKDINITPHTQQASSIGILSCLYNDATLTLEETILIALADCKFQNSGKRFKFIETELINAFAESLLLNELNKILPTLKPTKTLEKPLTAKHLVKLLKTDDTIETTKNSIRIDINGLITNGFIGFLEALGRLYNKGCEMRLDKLYPEIEWPVSRGTPMISPLIKWDHRKDWFVTKYRTQDIVRTGHRLITIIPKDEFWKYLGGHVVDGRNLFPATGYLNLAWEVLSMITGKMTSNMSIIFENVKFLRATSVPQKGTLQFTVMVQRGTGYFEVVEGGAAIVTGFIHEKSGLVEEFADLPIPTGFSNLPQLNQKDIYKELRLRGYHYKGQFKAIQSCNVDASSAIIDWNGNWVTFLDNLLQMQILQQDSRNLYVPTIIKRLVIDAHAHLEQAERDPKIPVYAWKDAEVIRSGAIEIRGLSASSIARRKNPEVILESYNFIPNQATLDLTTSININLQIAIENLFQYKVKIVEVATENYLINSIRTILSNQPLIEAELHLLTNEEITIDEVTVENKPLHTELDCYMIIINNFSKNYDLHKNLTSLRPGGFILSRECKEFTGTIKGFNILTTHTTDEEILLLLRSQQTIPKLIPIEMTEDLSFLQNLKDSLSLKRSVALYTSMPTSGILGLINCLKREPNGDKAKCFFMQSLAPEFDQNLEFFKEQIGLGLAVNVFRGVWGTYRHFKLDSVKPTVAEHCYVNVTTRGDLSSLSWIEGPLSKEGLVAAERVLVDVYYGSVNFRDVMTASGRVSVDAITRNRLEQECVQGFEFAGIDSSGRKVFGMLTSGALATMVAADKLLLVEVPSNWSLEDAVTVPVVYNTVLYAFFMRAGGLKEGQTVLIHSGTGGVGQAAINIALHHKCTIFTTVGTQEKRDFLLTNYPQLDPNNIGNSRDTTFESMIFNRTGGKGVDLILNSLSEDKLQASVRCLAKGGCFLEIGKFDLASDNTLSTQLLEKGASFHGIMLDALIISGSKLKRTLMDLLINAIKSGAVKPLIRTCFEKDQLESAFRFMATGKHIGKVVIKIREDQKHQIKAIPRFYVNGIAIIIGGLGGFGLELIDWLVLRGCRKIIITSRSGLKTGYQASRIKAWKSYGTTIDIIKDDLSNPENCYKLLEEAQKSGNVDCIFNLAVVLKDGILENQTIESFKESLNGKAEITKCLDVASRKICGKLRYFVVFSSVSCGRGNAGQTNYGMANSIMERICEQRRSDGYPALAIQWGAIGDVGLIADAQEDYTERAVGGTLQQRMSSCLEVLDTFLKQDQVVVSSMVVAEKCSDASSCDNMLDAVVNILGLRDLKTVSMHSTLAELGMDSMMAVEIKQTLEREYEVFLTPHDIRILTFARLQQIADEKEVEVTLKLKRAEKPQKEGVQYLLRFIDDEETSKIPVVKLNNLGTTKSPKVFILPGVEGFASIMSSLCAKLNLNTICLQYIYNEPKDTLQEIAMQLLPHVFEYLQTGDEFKIVAYSFGCTIAIELAYLLENQGYTGSLVLIDGAYDMMLKITHQQIDATSTATFETSLLCNIFTIYLPMELVDVYKDDLLLLENYEERVNFVQDKSPKTRFSRDYIKQVCIAFYNRVSAIFNYKTTPGKVKSKITLLRPTRGSVIDIAEDYNLSLICEQEVDVKFFDDDHYTILENDLIADEINQILLKQNIVIDDKEGVNVGDYKGLKYGVM